MAYAHVSPLSCSSTAVASSARLTRGVRQSLARLRRTNGPAQEPRRVRYYSTQAVREALGQFEEIYGLSSERFYDLYREDALPRDMPRTAANGWAALVEEYESMRVDEADLVEQFEVLGRR